MESSRRKLQCYQRSEASESTEKRTEENSFSLRGASKEEKKIFRIVTKETHQYGCFRACLMLNDWRTSYTARPATTNSTIDCRQCAFKAFFFLLIQNHKYLICIEDEF